MAVDSDEELRAILDLETIAVVGCSATTHKAAHAVPNFMRKQGYEIVPVNPHADEIFGVEPFDSLAEVDEKIDMVNVFRPSEEVAGIVDEAIDRDDVKAVWTQLGISDSAAGERVEAAGKRYVENRCLKIEYRRLLT